MDKDSLLARVTSSKQDNKKLLVTGPFIYSPRFVVP